MLKKAENGATNFFDARLTTIEGFQLHSDPNLSAQGRLLLLFLTRSRILMPPP
jgi:hypothetical protein